MFYSAHCMDPQGRQQIEALDIRPESAGSIRAKQIITELIQHFAALATEAKNRESWGLNAAFKLNDGVTWIANLFRTKVVPINPSDQSIIAGLYPSCSPDAPQGRVFECG